MEAFSVEKSINSARALVKELFDYIQNNAYSSDAYVVEQEIQRANLYLLNFINDEEYRRRILTQLNR